MVAQRRLNISTKVLAAGHFNGSLLYCVWRIPFQHHTMRAQAAHIFMSLSLASITLTWAAFSQPLSCFGFSTRNNVTTCRACAPGAQWRPVVSPLNCSVLPWRPIHPGQLEPTTLPLRRLAPDSCSVGLSPTLSHSLPLSLSCPLSCPLSRSPSLRSFSIAPHSLSLSPLRSSPTASHTHTHTLSLSLSLSLA